MQINAEGLAIVKRFEGLRLESYQDIAGIWTIGYGHTKGVRAGQKLNSEAEAEALLLQDLAEAERAVAAEMSGHFVPNENQFSAMVSLLFNIGQGAFHADCGVRRALCTLNPPDVQQAASWFKAWNKATVRRPDGSTYKKVIQGLVDRRAAEEALFRKPVAA